MVVEPFKGHGRPVRSVEFSPDGRRVVSGSDDGTIRVWDVETDKAIARPSRKHNHYAPPVMPSSDEIPVVSGGDNPDIQGSHIPVTDALAAAHTAPQFDDYSEIVNGWVLGANSELLFWVPPELRRGLYRPRNTLVLAPVPTTRLDLKKFVHGEAWTRCREHN